MPSPVCNQCPALQRLHLRHFVYVGSWSTCHTAMTCMPWRLFDTVRFHCASPAQAFYSHMLLDQLHPSLSLSLWRQQRARVCSHATAASGPRTPVPLRFRATSTRTATAPHGAAPCRHALVRNSRRDCHVRPAHQIKKKIKSDTPLLWLLCFSVSVMCCRGQMPRAEHCQWCRQWQLPGLCWSVSTEEAGEQRQRAKARAES